MKNTGFVLALAVTFALLAPSGGALGSVSCDGGYCDVTTDSIEYRYFPNSAVTIRNYGVSTDGGGKHVVFTLIEAGAFDSLEPEELGRTVSIMGAKASFETHDSAHATLICRALEPSNVIFTLDGGIGIVSLGSTAMIGDSEMLADMAATNGRTITKSVDNVIVDLQSDDMVVFRIQGPSGSVGELIASGILDVELDVKTNGPTIDADLTAYRQTASMAVSSVSSDRASFSFSGIEASSLAMIDISNDLFEPLKEHMTVKVGENALAMFDRVEDLTGSSEPGFVASVGPDYAEMLVRPGVASGEIVIENVLPGLDLLVIGAIIGSFGITAMAAVFLFRRKSV